MDLMGLQRSAVMVDSIEHDRRDWNTINSRPGSFSRTTATSDAQEAAKTLKILEEFGECSRSSRP
jgi:hypothetical protein